MRLTECLCSVVSCDWIDLWSAYHFVWRLKLRECLICVKDMKVNVPYKSISYASFWCSHQLREFVRKPVFQLPVSTFEIELLCILWELMDVVFHAFDDFVPRTGVNQVRPQHHQHFLVWQPYMFFLALHDGLQTLIYNLINMNDSW